MTDDKNIYNNIVVVFAAQLTNDEFLGAASSGSGSERLFNGCGSYESAITPDVLPQRVGFMDARPACNLHDVCYTDPRQTRSNCEQLFRDAMSIQVEIALIEATANLSNATERLITQGDVAGYVAARAKFDATVAGAIAMGAGYPTATAIAGGGPYEAAQSSGVSIQKVDANYDMLRNDYPQLNGLIPDYGRSKQNPDSKYRLMPDYQFPGSPFGPGTPTNGLNGLGLGTGDLFTPTNVSEPIRPPADSSSFDDSSSIFEGREPRPMRGTEGGWAGPDAGSHSNVA